MSVWVSGLPAGGRRLLRYWATLDYNENHDPKTGRFSSSGGCSDVTEEYKRTATPGKGTFDCVNKADRKRYPVETAVGEWIRDTFGGDVLLLPQSNRRGVKNPDYLWRGHLWDLKTPEGIKGIDGLLHTGIHQISENPGGLILDIRECGVDMDEAVKSIQYRVRRSASFPVDTIILMGNGEFTVLRVKGEKKTGND